MIFTADRAVADSRTHLKASAARRRMALALAVGLTATAVAPVLAALTVDAVPERVAPEQPPVALLSAMLDDSAKATSSAAALAQGMQQLGDKQYEEALASLQQAKPDDLDATQKGQLTAALAQADQAAGQRKAARAAFEQGEKALAAGDNPTAITQYAAAASTPNADAATVDKANTQIAVALHKIGNPKTLYDNGLADFSAGNLDAAKGKFWALDSVGYKPGGTLDKSPSAMLKTIADKQGTTPAMADNTMAAPSTPAAPAASDASAVAPMAVPAGAMSMTADEQAKEARQAYVEGRDAYHRGDVAGAKMKFSRSVDLGYHPGFGEAGPTKMLAEINKKEQADASRVARAQRQDEADVRASADAAAVTASQTNAANPAAPSEAPAVAPVAASDATPSTMPAAVATTPDMTGATVVATPPTGTPETNTTATNATATNSTATSDAAPADTSLHGTAAADRIRAEQNKYEAAHMVQLGDEAKAGGRNDDAIANYDQALKLDPNNQAAQAGKAQALSLAGRSEGTGTSPLSDFSKQMEAEAARINFTIQSALERSRQARQSSDFPGARSALIQAQAARDSGSASFNQDQLNGFDAAIRAETNAVNDAERTAAEAKAAKDHQAATDLVATQQKGIEVARRNTIASLVSQSRQLTNQGKFKDSLKVIDQILNIDPRNDYAIGVRPLIQDRVNLSGQRDVKERLNENLSDLLNQAEEARVPMPDILTYTPDWPDLSARRDEITSRERGGETDQATLALLARPLGTGQEEVKFDAAPFVDAVQFLADSTGANIFVNWPAIEAAGVDKNAPITVSRLRNVRFAKVLQIVLDSAGGGVTRLGYTIDDGVITISTQEDLAKNVSTQTFDIRDLLINVQDFNQSGFDFDQQNSGGGGGGQGGGGSGGSLFGNSGGSSNQNDQNNQVDRQQLVDQITGLITDTIASDTWKVNNGFIGAVQELGGQLIVTQTPENLAAIRQLLEKLRETRAIQVNIEARFLSVQRNFLEEVGVDFDFQFNVDYNKFPSTGTDAGQSGGTSDFSPVLVRQNSVGTGADGQPLGFTAPSQLVTGVASNLAATSSNYGLNTNVSAFLDDFRASLLLRAVQLGQNSTTLTAPRLTLFNGQQAYIRVTTQQSYVSSLTPVVSAGAVGYTAIVNQVDSGVFLKVQATVSSDRKYVTMTLQPQLSRLVALRSFSFATANTAIGGVNTNGTSAIQVATQTVQLPEVERTELATTVSVPDRGTLLLGGQTLLGEIERESGTPVLSKIPFLKRLFTNRGSAKDEQVLLILVKPTIIIQREVEQNSFPLLEPQ